MRYRLVFIYWSISIAPSPCKWFLVWILQSFASDICTYAKENHDSVGILSKQYILELAIIGKAVRR